MAGVRLLRIWSSLCVPWALAVSPAVAQEPPEPPRDEATEAPAAAGPEDPIVQDAAPEPTEALIERRIEELGRMPGAEEHASAALEHARLALGRARDLTRAGQAVAAERARQIAWAALSLASRRLDVVRERQALRSAALRLRRARARARRARTALEHAIEQRSELRAPEPEERTAPRAAPADDEGESE